MVSFFSDELRVGVKQDDINEEYPEPAPLLPLKQNDEDNYKDDDGKKDKDDKKQHKTNLSTAFIRLVMAVTAKEGGWLLELLRRSMHRKEAQSASAGVSSHGSTGGGASSGGFSAGGPTNAGSGTAAGGSIANKAGGGTAGPGDGTVEETEDMDQGRKLLSFSQS